MNNGYVRLYRSMLDHWVWKDKPFANGQAWNELILLVAWKEHKSPYGQVIMRGEIHTSQRWLGKRWGWGRKRVRSFLAELIKEKMITVVSQKNRGIDSGIRLYINNFERFQGGDTTKDTTMGTQKYTTKDTTNLPMNIGSKDTTMGTTKDTTMGTQKGTQQKKVVKKKGILEENYPAPTAAPDDGKSHLEESIKETRGNPWGLWCVAFKAKGFNIYPTPQGPDLAAAKTLKKLVPDVDELYYCMEKYLRDDDRFLSANGWGLRHLPKRLDTYRINYVKAQAKTVEDFGDDIPGETHDQGEFPKDEMDEIVAEAEKNRAS